MKYIYLKLIKFVKSCRQSNVRQERIPSSLAECLDHPSTSRREAWRFWLIILFILPTMYYINDLLLYEKFRFLNRGSKHDGVHSMRAIKRMVLSSSTTDMTTISIIKEIITQYPLGNLPICMVNNSELGIVSVRRPRKNIILENQYLGISKGGYYHPVGCKSRHKVAVLVPYRDRDESLSMFLYNIHPFLMKQKLEYRIFVVEQNGTDTFNKGRLFNAGFQEMKRFGSWQCIVFHDVDLIPLDERILYSCPSWPRHMCATVVQNFVKSHRGWLSSSWVAYMHYGLLHARLLPLCPSYHALFGGVTSMTPAQYEKVNGYSNLYWGWGGEDHDMFWRLRFAGLRVTRYNKTIARYASLPHVISAPNPLRYLLLHGGLGKYRQEGLSTLEYKLVSVTERSLYTHIVVDINPAREINANPIKLLRKL